MNRREFFQRFAAVPIAASLVVPELTRTIFLPPRHGWQPYKLGAGYMREVSQYVINYDEIWYRYDAIGRDIWGKEHQFHVDTRAPDPDMAREVISGAFARKGLIAVSPVKLLSAFGTLSRYV